MDQAKLPSASELARRVEQGETMSDIAREYGVTRQAVSYRVRKAGYDPVPKPQEIDLDQAKREFESGISVYKIAKRHGVSQDRMRRALRNAGYTMREPSSGGGHNRRKDEGEIIALYEEGKTVSEIAYERHCGTATVRRVLRRHGRYDPDRDRTVVPEEKRDRIVRRILNGESRYRVALEEAVSRETVEATLARAGITQQEDGTWQLPIDRAA